MTNEEKLNEIYDIVTRQESRLRRAAFFRFLKYLIILTALIYIVMNPDKTIGKFLETMRPYLMDQVNAILSDQKEALMKDIQ